MSHYSTMTNEELTAELAKWEKNVETATGWSSAYFAAKQVKYIVAEGKKRGLNYVNNYPIKVG